MSSSVTGSVVGWPSITMPRLSPTRRMGMPASSRIRALRKSYAVSTANRRPSSLNRDRKSTRLNSSHSQISYAVFCLKKKKSLLRLFVGTLEQIIQTDPIDSKDVTGQSGHTLPDIHLDTVQI